jgi:NAD(P)H-hydrate repair Nnr-like enzyme with NAD(P)H-hydrate epimerase domain
MVNLYKIHINENFTASQIKACDEFTIRNEPISSVFLMERAAKNV